MITSCASTDLSYLSSLDEESFNKERDKILADFIKSAPAVHHKPLIRLQLKLNAFRRSTSADEFMMSCLSQAVQNIENIDDMTNYVSHLCGEVPIVRSAAER